MAVRPIDAMELKQRMCALCNQAHSDEPCEPSDCVFVRAINEAPTLTPPNEWVSVEERMPEESDGMVLFTNGRAVTSGYRNYMFRMSDEEGVYAPAIGKYGGYMRVTHWMPLPAPPDCRPPEGEEDT